MARELTTGTDGFEGDHEMVDASYSDYLVGADLDLTGLGVDDVEMGDASDVGGDAAELYKSLYSQGDPARKVRYNLAIMRRAGLSFLSGVKGRVLFEKGTDIGAKQADVDCFLDTCEKLWVAEDLDPHGIGQGRYVSMTGQEPKDLEFTPDMKSHVIRRDASGSAELTWVVQPYLDVSRTTSVRVPGLKPCADRLTIDQKMALARQPSDGTLRPWLMTYLAMQAERAKTKRPQANRRSRAAPEDISVTELVRRIQADRSLSVNLEGVDWKSEKIKDSGRSRGVLRQAEMLAQNLATRRATGKATVAEMNKRYGYVVTARSTGRLEIQEGPMASSGNGTLRTLAPAPTTDP